MPHTEAFRARLRGEANWFHLHPEDAWRIAEHPERRARGERVNTAKLTAQDVQSIRWLHANGTYTQARLGEMFGVSLMSVNRIVHRQSWRHVDDIPRPVGRP
jgi:hypothetical protein